MKNLLQLPFNLLCSGITNWKDSIVNPNGTVRDANYPFNEVKPGRGDCCLMLTFRKLLTHINIKWPIFKYLYLCDHGSGT